MIYFEESSIIIKLYKQKLNSIEINCDNNKKMKLLSKYIDIKKQ